MKPQNVRKLDLEQGSQDWHDMRKDKITASQVPVMCGYAGSARRNQLIKELATGKKEPIDPFLQAIFDEGHRLEEIARKRLEAELKETVIAPTYIGDYEGYTWLASLDGIDSNGVVWEHKTINKKLREAKTLPKQYKAQLMVQMLLSGSKKGVLEASNEKESRKFEVKWSDKLMEEIVDKVDQFMIDVLEYEDPELEDPELEAKLEQYRALKEQYDQIGAELKALAEEVKEFADGKNEIQCAGFSIKKSVRKGSVKYSDIPELKEVDLDSYRGEDSVYYTIKEL